MKNVTRTMTVRTATNTLFIPEMPPEANGDKNTSERKAKNINRTTKAMMNPNFILPFIGHVSSLAVFQNGARLLPLSVHEVIGDMRHFA